MRGTLLPLILSALALIALVFVVIPDGAAALAVTVALSLIALVVFRQFADDRPLITSIFLLALAVRLAFGLFVHIYDLRDFFGGDANSYDFLGNELMLRWTEAARTPNVVIDFALQNLSAGWGMYYLVGGIYWLVGHNILAAQSVCGVIGAATAPMIYFCADSLFGNRRVAFRSAMLVALFPAFIIWSAQLLKDGLIVFLLVLAMTMVIELQRKFSYGALIVLVLAVAGVLPLRFYIFFMLVPAVIGSFLIGVSASPRAIIRNTLILVVLGLGLTYLGAMRNAGVAFDQYATLAAVQSSRSDLSGSAASGFGSDVDVSTTQGAISAIPVGLTYLMLAPFPWEISSLRSAIPLPEVLVWWTMLPIVVFGIAWTVRNRLQKAFPILLFALMLTISYSIFQGNVGTAYRQRTQIQVFLFMFLSVGWTLRQEKRENEKIVKASRGIRPRTPALANARTPIA
jgi:hypothetical protein